MKKLTLVVALVAFASAAYAQGTHPSPGHGAAGNPNNTSDVAKPKSKLHNYSTLKHYHFSGTHPSPGHGAAGNPNE